MHPKPLTTVDQKRHLTRKAESRLELVAYIREASEALQESQKILETAQAKLVESTQALASYVGGSRHRVAVALPDSIVCLIQDVPGDDKANIDFIRMIDLVTP